VSEIKKYLLYCIFCSQKHKSHGTVLGVHGQPVSLVSNKGISAAISGIPDPALTPDISSILTYQKVVDSFHFYHTVIPMRYGCLFNTRSDLIRLLKEQCKHYKALLKELTGCVEIGIRILVPKPEVVPLQPATCKSQIANPGRAYLAARKAHYAEEERFTEEMNLVFQRCRSAFSGLFVRCKEEYPAIQNWKLEMRNPKSQFRNRQLASIYFLVPRSSVGPFRKVFGQISIEGATGLLLSGPWPPYNFVESEPGMYLA
jgi:hypothetical protein